MTEEWVYWSDESSHNLNAASGLHPRVIRSKFKPVFTKLFYCYYQPKPREFFSVGYFVNSVLTNGISRTWFKHSLDFTVIFSRR